MALLSGSHLHNSNIARCLHDKTSPPDTLQILSYETAKTMSRLIALHKFFSGDEISDLRKGPMRSKGVHYLNSQEENILLNLACQEKLEQLNVAADSIGRLGRSCSDLSLRRFDQIFANLKQGIIDAEKVKINNKKAEKIAAKMDKYVTATLNLDSAVASLAEMELSERKFQQRNLNICSKLPQKTNLKADFNEKLASQRKLVRHYRDISLWNKKFDKCVGLMARIIYVVYARLCEVFGPHVPGLPPLSTNIARHIRRRPKPLLVKVHPELDYCVLNLRTSNPLNTPRPKTSQNLVHCLFHQEPAVELSVSKHSSCFTPKNSQKKSAASRFVISTDKESAATQLEKSRVISNDQINKSKRLCDIAAPSTVGGAGLAMRYANIIILAERFMYTPREINEESRETMYNLLPGNLRETMRRRLWRPGNKKDGKRSKRYSKLAEMWRGMVEEILEWLAPMAHDTVQWQTERAMEMQRLAVRQPTVMLLQTLHFSDLEKTNAAIADVLVGLSCICRYQYGLSWWRRDCGSAATR